MKNVLFSRLWMRSLWILVPLSLVGGVSFANEKLILEPDRSPSIPSSKSTPSQQKIDPLSSSDDSVLDLIDETQPVPKTSPIPTKTPEANPSNTSDRIAPNVPNTPTPKPTIDPKLKPQERSTAPEIGEKIARSIAVKIIAPDFIGTGTIVGDRKGVYTLLTNAHVVLAGKAPYKIVTNDRVVYQAKLVPHPQFKKHDLAILQFRAPAKKYSVGQLGKSASLQVGDRLFVGGFTKQAKQRDPDDFLLQTGAVSLILKSPIDDTGYKIGYTHFIYRGMSGGPVVDRAGRLVGINGMLNDPVWKTIIKFADGSSACEPLQNAIDRSAFAIPIDDVTRLIPKAKWWKKAVTNSNSQAEERSIDNQEEIMTLRRAAVKALSCQ
jgi:S1-C subfamily serine protease